MATRLRGPKLELRCTICDEVSSYVIYTMRGIQFAVEMIEGKPTTRERLGRSSMTVGMALGGASAPRASPAAAV
jgi:hypothetical protein